MADLINVLRSYLRRHNSGQYYKALYDRNIRLSSRNTGCFEVRYDSSVVIYEHKIFTRLATVFTIGDFLYSLTLES